MISHFFLQQGGVKQGEVDVEASAYASSLGASSELVDEIRRTQRKTGVSAGTVRSATSSVSFVAGTITGSEKPKRAHTQRGVTLVVPNVPVVHPKPGPLPGTAIAGASSIGQMMGVPPEVPPAQPLIPLGLLWRPDVKKSDQGEGIIWRRFGNNKFIG